MLSIIIMGLVWPVIVAIIFSAALAYAIGSWGFVITKLWAWLLVVPFGLTAITFSQAVAIAVILGTIKTFVNPELNTILKIKEEPKEGEYPKWVKLAVSLSLPWIALVFAWIVKTIFIA